MYMINTSFIAAEKYHARKGIDFRQHGKKLNQSQPVNHYNTAGQDINICGDLPSTASEIQFSRALLQLSAALEELYVLCFI